MAIKPCELVLVKRSPQDVELQKTYEPDYYSTQVIGSQNTFAWVKLRSNATLFHRRDAKRDLIPHLSTFSLHQILQEHQCIATTFELVELIEKKSFGWIIQMKPVENQLHPQCDTFIAVAGATFVFQYQRQNASILNTEEKDHFLKRAQEDYPDRKFFAVELFTQ